MILAFDGASWGCLYYIGVYKALIERKLLDDLEVYADSAGCLIALCILLKIPYEKTKQIYDDLAHKANKFGVIGKMTSYHNEGIDNLLANPNDFMKLNNRLHIGLTMNDGSHKWISNFTSNDDLRSALLGSFHIPFYCSHLPIFRNEYVLDGSFSSHHNDLPKGTITIAVDKSKKSDISYPLSTITKMYPITKETEKYNTILQNGFNNMMDYKVPIHKIEFLGLNHWQLKVVSKLSDLYNHPKTFFK